MSEKWRVIVSVEPASGDGMAWTGETTVEAVSLDAAIGIAAAPNCLAGLLRARLRGHSFTPLTDWDDR